MSLFNQVDKAVQQDLFGIVKFQLITHCFLNDIILNKTDLDCLTLLGCRGKIRLIDFCTLASDMKILGTPTAVNNCLARIEKSKLFLKEGAGKKQIFLNPDLGIQTKGNILLNFKFVCVDEAGALEGVGQENGAATQST